MPTPLPVVTVSGYLGAGKTTALESLVQGLRPARAGWVIQDVSGLSDAGLTVNASWQRIEARLPDNAGCLGCTLRADLLAEVQTLVDRGAADVLLIEVPGILDAAHVSRCLGTDEQLARRLRVGAHVAVVDAPTFVADLQEAGGDLPLCGDDRSLAELRITQVEQAHTIVLTKAEHVAADEAARVAGLLALLRPGAPVLHPAEVRGSAPGIAGRRDFRGAATGPPLTSHRSPARSGAARVRFSADRPFHPARLAEALATPLPGVLRGRGRAWLASQPQVALAWEQSAAALVVEPAGTWSTTGRIALELIGLDLDRAAIRSTLAACVLTDAELAVGPAAWAAITHPFPIWDVDALDVLPDPSTPGGTL